MRKREQLFDLIKSMSPSEKRYFKLYCGRENSGANYLSLFDAIDAQESYDERLIKQKFDDQKFVRQLHVLKNYLQTLIMKSLRQFHSEGSRDAEVKNMLINVEILFNKELNQHCMWELNKAQKIAEKFELFTALVEIHDWRRRLKQNASPHAFDSFRIEIDAQHSAIQTLNNTNVYRKVIVDLSDAILNGLDDVVDNEEILDDVSNARSLEARVLHANANYFRKIQLGNTEDGDEIILQLITEMESKKNLIEASPSLYLSTINNLISYNVFNKQYERALATIERSRAIIENIRLKSENRVLIKQVLRTYNIELEISRDTRAFEQDPTSIEAVERFVDRHQRKMPTEYLISFWFQLSNIRFMQGDMDASLELVNNIIQYKWKATRLDIQLYARYLNLMIHLEKQNLFVLRYFVDGTRRFINKVKEPDEIDRILLSFFSRISKVPLLQYRREYMGLFDQLFPDGTPINKALPALDYIDFKYWLEPKVR